MYNNISQNGTDPYYGTHPSVVVNPLGIPQPGAPFTMIPPVQPMVLPDIAAMNIPGYDSILHQAYYQNAMNFMNNMLPLQAPMAPVANPLMSWPQVAPPTASTSGVQTPGMGVRPAATFNQNGQAFQMSQANHSTGAAVSSISRSQSENSVKHKSDDCSRPNSTNHKYDDGRRAQDDRSRRRRDSRSPPTRGWSTAKRPRSRSRDRGRRRRSYSPPPPHPHPAAGAAAGAGAATSAGAGAGAGNRSRNYRRSPPIRSSESRSRKDTRDDSSRDRKFSSEKKNVNDDLRFSSDNYSSEDESEKIPELSEEDYRMEIANYTRCLAAEVYFKRQDSLCFGTERFSKMLEEFSETLLKRNEKAKSTQKAYERPKRKPHICMHFKKKPKVIHHRHDQKFTKPVLVLTSDDSDSSSESDWCSSDDEENLTELEIKKQHPYRLHEELWFNDSGEMNDGPLCRCSIKSRRSGIRHNCFPGETAPSPACDPNSNNADKLFHYRIFISPKTNFVLKKFPTVIKHDKQEYIFEGFSLFSHYKLPDNLPSCRIIRYNIEYLIAYIPEDCPDNFTVGGLDVLTEYLFKEILELVDVNWKLNDQVGGCPQFHLMPRFVRPLVEKGKELLSLNYVIHHLLRNSKPLVSQEIIPRLARLSDNDYIDYVETHLKAQIVVNPGMKPCSMRVDQLDRENSIQKATEFPEIIHFGMRPAQLSYAGNPQYQKAFKELTKFKKYLATKPRVDYRDKAKLNKKEKAVMELKQAKDLKRDVTVVTSSAGFFRTGVRSDVVQHALIIPVLIGHLRFHRSLHKLEDNLKLKFNDRLLLQLALTHPSYRENFGTNPDHARNAMSNCGMRQPKYGDRRVLYLYSRKRGIKMLLSIMSRLAKDIETASTMHHYERLEFLGDAVIEFLSSIHLFHMFPEVEEGGLATYRAALVQNQHLAILAKKLQLDEFMLYAHGSDLCHDLELKHAMANSFEALMGSIFLDHGIDEVDRVFGETLFDHDPQLLNRWKNYRRHPLQLQEPDGDRHWIEHYPILQKMTVFEKKIGVEFKHIRLLARAFTHRSVGYNNLTLGSNQRLEFLGDTVLQLVSSEYLYKFFPEHHEGHLSLLRSSIVNNRTQSVVHDDLGMIECSLYPSSANGLKMKDRADILEAFLGSLFVDKGLEYCRRFCQVVFFPRLEQFIRNQDWNDPKSKLQQCCLTLRHMCNGQPEIPLYKVIDSSGPTNTRRYTVAVYFRGKRMATASGHSIKDAQYQAAALALANYKEFFNHKVVEDIIKGSTNRDERKRDDSSRRDEDRSA